MLAEAEGEAIVLYGDTPFVRVETLEAMRAARSRHQVVILGFEPADPGRYGRLIVEGDQLMRIVEWKDASAAERALKLCNSGVVCAGAKTLFRLVAQVGNANAAGEYYLTDLVGLARADGQRVAAVLGSEEELRGINSRAELAVAEATSSAPCACAPWKPA